jgi:hypothetical protein
MLAPSGLWSMSRSAMVDRRLALCRWRGPAVRLGPGGSGVLDMSVEGEELPASVDHRTKSMWYGIEEEEGATESRNAGGGGGGSGGSRSRRTWNRRGFRKASQFR